MLRLKGCALESLYLPYSALLWLAARDTLLIARKDEESLSLRVPTKRRQSNTPYSQALRRRRSNRQCLSREDPLYYVPDGGKTGQYWIQEELVMIPPMVENRDSQRNQTLSKRKCFYVAKKTR